MRIFFILITLNFCSAFSGWALPVKIIHVSNAPDIRLLSSEKTVKAQIHQILEGDVRIKTTESQIFKIDLNGLYTLTIFPSTEILLNIDPYLKVKKAYRLNLFNGKIYILKNENYKSEDSSDPLLTYFKLQSDFFDWKLKDTDDINMMINFIKPEAKISFCQRQGTTKVNLFDHEIQPELKQNQGQFFHGVIEKNEIVFDLLLNKRKIPKGYWQEVFDCDFTQIAKIEKELADLELSQASAILRAKKAKIDKKNADDAKYLCHEPYGQLNQCSWIMTGNKCNRKRCDAEGKWSDLRPVVPINKDYCFKDKPAFVAKCLD